MNFRVRLLLVATLVFLLGAALFVWQPANSAGLYSGYARADSGPLTLELSVDPPVGLPGDILQLTARVTNRSAGALSPSVVLQLPHGTSADVYALPAGATLNLQENRVDWLPVVPGGAVVDFTLNLTVQAADVLSPEQSLSAILRHQGSETTADAPLWIGIAPLIGDMLPQDQVAVGQPIQLHATIAGPGPISAVWDLGDGRRLEVSDPVVVFPTGGEHLITVEATNPGGTSVRQAKLTVLPDPVASFQPDDDEPEVGQAIIFLNNSGGEGPLKVYWDFGDGATLVGEQGPSHTYHQSGEYRVRLTIENAYGRSEAVWDVSVGAAPVADMVIVDRTAVGQPITGQAFGDGSVGRFLWDMGDGRQHEGATVSHLYRYPGDYYVTMTADNGHGQVQAGRWVHVDGGTTTLYMPLTAFQAGGTFTALSADTPAELDPVVQNLNQVFVLQPIPFPAGTTPAEQLYAYLNAARATFGLPPLAYNYELSSAAQEHASDKARFPDNPHVGSDGTTAAERLLRVGYGGGYAGEATAWGFNDPRLAVEFWMNSDTHRPLLLNRLATDAGVGYVEDGATSNIWHWTAEFGVSYGAPARAVLRTQSPMAGYSAVETELTNYEWLWPLPLSAGQRFTVYVLAGQRLVPLGSVAEPVYGSRYVMSADARSALGPMPVGLTGHLGYTWLVRLEDGSGGVVAESESRPIAFTADPNMPLPTATPIFVTATPNAPTSTPTPTPWPTPTSPPFEVPPIIVTATPLP